MKLSESRYSIQWSIRSIVTVDNIVGWIYFRNILKIGYTLCKYMYISKFLCTYLFISVISK